MEWSGTVHRDNNTYNIFIFSYSSYISSPSFFVSYHTQVSVILLFISAIEICFDVSVYILSENNKNGDLSRGKRIRREYNFGFA